MTTAFAILAFIFPCFPQVQDGLTVGDKGTYAIIVNGERQGTSSYSVENAENAGIIINCQTQLNSVDGQVNIESQTFIDKSGVPSAYRLSAGTGNQEQILEVDFAEGNAICTLRVGGVHNESQVILPERWMIFDNNSAAHLALLAARLKPGMDPDGGQIFVPSTFTLADYYIASQGAGIYEIGGGPVQTQFYRMILANKVEVDLHVVDGHLLVMRIPSENIEFIREQ